MHFAHVSHNADFILHAPPGSWEMEVPAGSDAITIIHLEAGGRFGPKRIYTVRSSKAFTSPCFVGKVQLVEILFLET